MTYTLTDKHLEFLTKLRDRVDLEIKATKIHDTKAAFLFELIDMLDRVISDGEYDKTDKLMLSALRTKYKDKL